MTMMMTIVILATTKGNTKDDINNNNNKSSSDNNNINNNGNNNSNGNRHDDGSVTTTAAITVAITMNHSVNRKDWPDIHNPWAENVYSLNLSYILGNDYPEELQRYPVNKFFSRGLSCQNC